MALGGLCLAVNALAPRFMHPHAFAPGEWLEARPTIWLEHVKTGGIVAIVVGLLLSLLGGLFASFTVFAAVSIYGVFLGTGAPIMALSVMSGFENDLKTKIRSTKADVVVERSDDRPFTDFEAVDEKLQGIPGLVGSMPYVEAEVIVKHATNPAGMGIILRGVDASRAPRVLGIERTLKEGKVGWLDHPEQIPTEEVEMMREPPASGRQGPRTGATQARRSAGRALRTSRAPGFRASCSARSSTSTRCASSSAATSTSPARCAAWARPARCPSSSPSGWRATSTAACTSSTRSSPTSASPTPRSSWACPGEVTGIEIRTVTPEAAHDVAEEIGRRLGPGYEVRSWEELNRGLFAALKLEKLAMFVVLTFIALVASFSIVSNLIMLVTEKGREVAILKSMGARDGAILRVFFAEGLYIGLLGLGFGLALGIGGCLLLGHYGLPLNPDVYYIEKLPVVMRASEIAAVSLAGLFLCCLATLYPALLASRLSPAQGLRYE